MNYEQELAEQNKWSDIIFTAITTGDYNSFEEAMSVVMLYITDMSVSRAGISHALKRLEDYYNKGWSMIINNKNYSIKFKLAELAIERNINENVVDTLKEIAMLSIRYLDRIENYYRYKDAGYWYVPYIHPIVIIHPVVIEAFNTSITNKR